MQSIRDLVLVLKGRRVIIILPLGRRKRLMFHMDLKDRAVATKVKAKVNHPGVGETLEILAS